jgi:hypothetical protein
VESYYKELFGAEPKGAIALGEGFWNEEGRLSDEDAKILIKPFTIKEIEDALKDMDTNASLKRPLIRGD